MSEFTDISLAIKANIYFDGNVSSRTVNFPDGSRKTLGVMLPGEYHFATDAAELMEITQGKAEYRLAGQDAWNKVETGGEFRVPEKSYFDIRVVEVLDYCCSFL